MVLLTEAQLPSVAGAAVVIGATLADRLQSINDEILQGTLQFAIFPTAETPVDVPDSLDPANDVLLTEWDVHPANTPDISIAIRPGVFTQEMTGSQGLTQDNSRYVFWSRGSFTGNNVIWRFSVKAGKDLGLPGEFIEQVFTATIASSGPGDEADLHIEGRGIFTSPTLYTGPREFSVFVGRSGGGVTETYTPILTDESIGTIWSDGPTILP